MKDWKATGPDAIPVEYIKLYQESPEAAKKLTEMFQQVWRTKEAPQSWKNSIIEVIYKNKGSKDECGNYRGVSLLDHVGKVLLKIVTERLSKYAEAHGLLPEEQSGFRPKRSTVDMLYVVQMLQEFGRVKKVPLYFSFIDLTKAYDTVNRQLLWKVLAKAGIPQELIGLIKAFHDGTQACVRIEGEDSAYFSVNQGLRQGCVLAPLLFNLFFAAVLQVVKKRILADEATRNDLVTVKSGMKLDPWVVPTRKGGGVVENEKTLLTQLWSMLYADDAAIVSRSESGLVSMMTIIVETTAQFGMMVSENKTKIMYTARESELKTRRVTITVTAAGQSYEQVVQFTYLGTKLSEGGGVSVEIAQRSAKAWGKWHVRKKALYQNKGVRPGVKLEILKQEVIETLIYGCGAWTTNAKDMAHLNSVHYKLLIQTLELWKEKKKKSDRPRSYSSILKQYRLDSMETTVKLRRLKWAGSVMRMKDNRLPKIMMFGELAGVERSMGGQPSQWKTELLTDMIDFGLMEKEGNDASVGVYNAYKAKMWKDMLHLAEYPAKWKVTLIRGANHFMRKWHEKEELESAKRARKRAIEYIRFRVRVFNGWTTESAERVVIWKKFDEKWKEVQCEIRELGKKMQVEAETLREFLLQVRQVGE